MPTSQTQKIMSKGGGIQKLPELALLAGASSPKADIKIGPKLQGEMPKAPSKERMAVKREYNHHCKIWQLLLSPQDAPMLLEYCRLRVEYQGLYEQSLKEGAIVTNKHGNKMQNPTFLLMLKAMDMLHRYRIRLGATPVDRNKIPNKTVKASDVRNNPGQLLT